MLDWDKLRIFHAVAEAGSFTKAGEALHSSQSAVSRQIIALEENLGLTLFHRHARGLKLTEQGELLHKTTSDIFTSLSIIEGKLLDTKKLPKGPLRITLADFIGSTWLAPKLHILRKEHPDLQLTFILDDRILNLGMREADAAIRLQRPKQPDLIQRHLTTIHFHITASKSYLELYGYPQSPEDLADHTLIAFPDDTLSPFQNPNWILQVADVDLKSTNNLILINSISAIERAVNDGAGIAALPDYMIKSNPNLEILFPDLQREPVEMYFVYSEERRHSQRIAIFRDFLIKNIAQTDF